MPDRLLVRSVGGCAAGLAAILVSAGAASAARPVAHARYTGVAKGNTAWAELRTASRRSFRASRSTVELVYPSCDGGRRQSFALGTRRASVRIRRGGRFHFSRLRGKFKFTVSGRVKSRNTLVIVVRNRRRPTRASNPCDDSGRHRITLRRVRRGHRAGCGQRGRTRAWAPEARIFRKGPQFGHMAYGCLFSRGRAFLLDEDEDPDSELRLFRIAAPYVAYAIDSCPMGCGWGLTVFDLRTGKRTRNIATGSEGLAGTGPVADLELASNGSVAWIVSASPIKVQAEDTLGERLLDSGNSIAPKSLELHGSTLTWINAGVTRSATLH